MIKEIKKYFNVSSVAIAAYTGNSLSVINSVITSRRLLNTKMLKLLPLYEALLLKASVNELSSINSFKIKEQEATKNNLNDLLNKTSIKIEKQEFLLSSLQKRRNYWLRGLNACLILLEDEKIKDKKWIMLRKKHLEQKLIEQASSYQEIVLITKIKGLKTQLAEIKKQLFNNS